MPINLSDKKLYQDHRSTLYRYSFEIEKKLRDTAQTHSELQIALQETGSLHRIDLIDCLLDRIYKKDCGMPFRVQVIILRCIALESRNIILIEHAAKLTL